MILDAALREAGSGEGPIALVTLAKVSGSTPREAGSRMAVHPDGEIVGTVGGGKPEAQAREAALALLAAKAGGGEAPSVSKLHVEMTGADAKGVDLICGGIADIWIEVLEDRRLYSSALELIDRGERLVLVSSSEAGSIALVEGGAIEAGRFPPRLDGGALAKALSAGLCVLGESDGLLYSSIEPPEKLLILGGGHVGRAVAEVAMRLSFAVSVADPRPEYSDPARFPAGVDCRKADFVETIERFPQGEASYVVVVSPGHLGDLDCARVLIRGKYRYVGIIGSKRKSRMIIETLVGEGAPRDRAEALRMPIGLDIGALTPEEIAVAVAAELIAVRHDSPALAWIDADRERRREGAKPAKEKS
jgi:xanthine dehydrogenase accessory factor